MRNMIELPRDKKWKIILFHTYMKICQGVAKGKKFTSCCK